MLGPVTRLNRLSLLLCGVLVGCGGGGNSRPTDAAEVARSQTVARLQGRWVLVDFRPEQPLEPMLASLLAAQLGAMTLDVSGQQLTATGLGLQAQRTVTVTQVVGDQVTLAILDQNRLDYEISGSFYGDEFQFAALTPPWRGQGRLKRAP